MNHRERFLELQALLTAHETWWRPAPFRVRRPDWCDERPALAEAVLALDAAALARYADDPAVCCAWLASWLPVVDRLGELAVLPALPSRPLPLCAPHFDWSIPGRKREQIEAFAAHRPIARAPVLEWCAGKGHLGRRVALADRVPVASLEIDPVLCADASHLAARAGVEQVVLCADALDDSSRSTCAGAASSRCTLAASCTVASSAAPTATVRAAIASHRAVTRAAPRTATVR